MNRVDGTAGRLELTLSRRAAVRLAVGSTVGLILAAAAAPADAADRTTTFFRLGTGGTAGTYYPIGRLIAAQLTDHLGAACIDDCPDPRMLAVAQASNGSVSNVKELVARRLEAGLVQADIAHWGYRGEGIFSGRSPMRELRAIGRLYSETLHIVARADAGIRRFDDLRGQRVSLDEEGSGTLIAARLVLEAHGLGEARIEPIYIKPDLAIQRMRAGQLEAFFTVAGAPVRSITALASELPITLVPIDAERQRAIAARVPFFAPALIPAALYPDSAATASLEVGALLLTRADLDEDLIYRVTSVLWNEDTHEVLAKGHARGRTIRLNSALDGLPLPLHPGAERFYRGTGLLPP
ncbi:TAXI family TRAP transporter solute-binding subunit [Algihabitans albus]|uniref:TAXI family TRAP transporter solute-binding subunit n=1 Tax=Algihabitans albus TaxID=2164067 RepID=UPI000E5D3F30|nr:TAXI family TRAP transporter solute-binding subunit [Algihabitans albus]